MKFFYTCHLFPYPLLTYSWWPSMEIVRIINHKKSSNISLQSSAKLVLQLLERLEIDHSFYKECLLCIVLLLTWCAYPSEVQLKVYSISCTIEWLYSSPIVIFSLHCSGPISNIYHPWPYSNIFYQLLYWNLKETMEW